MPFCGTELLPRTPGSGTAATGISAMPKARYRARHTESANCKGCGVSFKRSVTSKRKAVLLLAEVSERVPLRGVPEALGHPPPGWRGHARRGEKATLATSSAALARSAVSCASLARSDP